MSLHPARALVAVLGVILALLTLAQGAQAAPTGGSGGPLTDRTFQSYTGPSGVTSRYHVYAAGLDWSREVGLLIYADGSGQYGLANPDSGYLLGGTNGLVTVAKRHNMVLLTPLAAGGDCPDGGGPCWHATSSGITPASKARWSFESAQHVKSQYRIETDRVAIGGYSSGAQWATQYFAPMFGSQLMTDGVVVAISYGGPPNVAASVTPQHQATVAYSWDVGERDAAGARAAQAGYNWYARNGFTTTQLQIVPGEDHSRSGQFGAVMDREITEHVRPALPVGDTPTPPSTPALTPTSTSTSGVMLAPAARSFRP